MRIRKRAHIDPSGRYRYTLSRDWTDSGPRVMWVMLNPSTADAQVDDPTIRRCIAFSQAWGFCGLTVCNLFALRATDPKELYRADAPVGPENDWILKGTAAAADTIVCAWGNHGVLYSRARKVAALLREVPGPTLTHLGLTKQGQPQHPLRLPGHLRPIPWEGQ